MRKYTMDYYLDILTKQNTKELFLDLMDYRRTIIPEIQNRYKKLSKGEYIDYVSRYEDFWLITTYRLSDLLTCAFTVIRYKNGKKHFQYYERYYCFGVYSWCRHKMNHFNKRYLYSRNLKELFNGTEYQYSYLWYLAEKIDVSARNFLGYLNSENLKYVECLTKLNCFKMARDIINGKMYNHTFVNIFKDFGYSCFNDFKYVIDNDLDYNQSRKYRNYKGFNLEDKYFKYFKTYCDIHSFEDVGMSFISSKSLVKYYLDLISRNNIKNNFEDFLSDYRDYYRFGSDLGYDFTDTKYSKPKDFNVAHDMASMKYQSKQAMVKKKEFSKVVRKIKKFAFYGDKYSIVIPCSPEDIILEGKNNSNCVGGYIDRIVKGYSYIFFVRRTNNLNKSFFTLEINPKTMAVVQCRGFANQPNKYDKSVRIFVDKWLKDVVKVA